MQEEQLFEGEYRFRFERGQKSGIRSCTIMQPPLILRENVERMLRFCHEALEAMGDEDRVLLSGTFGPKSKRSLSDAELEREERASILGNIPFIKR